MATVTYDTQLAALLVVDPYNDFISEGGKIWPPIKAVCHRCHERDRGVDLSPLNHCDNVRFWHLADIGLCAAHVRF